MQDVLSRVARAEQARWALAPVRQLSRDQKRGLRPRHPVVYCKQVRSRPSAALLCFQCANLRNVRPGCAQAPALDGAPAASGGVASKNYRTSAKVVCIARSTWKIALR